MVLLSIAYADDRETIKLYIRHISYVRQAAANVRQYGLCVFARRRGKRRGIL